MSRGIELQPLSWHALFALLLAMFAISVGYGIVLPILPFLIERLAGTADAATLSWHTGLITGTYILAIFLFAPLWGKVSDRWGRRPVLLHGPHWICRECGAVRSRRKPAAALPRPVPRRPVCGGDCACGLCSRRRSCPVEGMARPPLRPDQHRGDAGFFVGPLLGGLVLGAFRDSSPKWPSELFPHRSLPPRASRFVAALTIWGLVPGAVAAGGQPGSRRPRSRSTGP